LKPVVSSLENERAGAEILPSGSFNCPVMPVEPLTGSEPVSAVAISDKSELTAAEDIVVPAVNAD
jgi:hypothetical protein